MIQIKETSEQVDLNLVQLQEWHDAISEARNGLKRLIAALLTDDTAILQSNIT